jgi:hypothetical protein
MAYFSEYCSDDEAFLRNAFLRKPACPPVPERTGMMQSGRQESTNQRPLASGFLINPCSFKGMPVLLQYRPALVLMQSSNSIKASR